MACTRIGRRKRLAAFLAAALSVACGAAQGAAETTAAPEPAAPSAAEIAVVAPPSAPVALEPVFDAATLETRLNRALKRWAARQNIGQAKLQWRGVASVVAVGDGGGYRVTLPPIVLDAGQTDDLEVGSVAMTATPQADGSYALTDLALPPEFVIRDGSGRPGVVFRIGRVAFTGIWVPQYENFRQIDLAIHDFRGEPLDPEEGSLRIDALRLTSTMAETGSFWSGPSSLTFQGVLLVGPEQAEWLRLDHLEFAGHVVNLDMNRIAALSQRLDTLPLTPAAMPPSPLALVEALDELQGALGGLGARFNLAGLTFRDPDEEVTLRLGGLEFSSSIEGLDQEHSRWRAGYRHDTLSLKPTPAPKEVIPQTVTVEVSAAPMPNAALWKTLRGLLGTLAANPGQGQEVIDLLLPQVRDTLVKAGSTFAIDKLHTETSSLQGDVSGQAVLNPASPQGATATARVILTGLDATVKGLRPAKGSKPDPEAQELVAALTMAQALGQAGKDAQGRDTRTYNLELAVDGRVSLNGADISALLGTQSEEKPAKGGKKK